MTAVDDLVEIVAHWRPPGCFVYHTPFRAILQAAGEESGNMAQMSDIVESERKIMVKNGYLTIENNRVLW